MTATVLEPAKSSPQAAPSRRDRPRRGREQPRALTLVLAVLAMLVSLVPFYWLINTSLKTGAELSSGSLYPTNASLNNYLDVLQDGEFLTALGNSLIVGAVTTTLALTFASFAAYALARLKLPRKGLLLGLVLSVTTFPVISIAAPMFKIWSDIGLYDTLLGLIIPKLTFALPMAIFVLTSFFREIPFELEESALIDGATPFSAFRKVILPLAVPGIATTAILVFISVWNEFLLAVTLTSTPDARTVPVAIAYFSGVSEFDNPIGTISAASVLVTLPLVVLVLVFQKRIVAGLTAGAIKG
ncbi:carbohydrate ABC transporter permease [Saccharopolyspora halophila]|uniref:Carbohydrate ABC transporter permease n=1 Tax=Saccharopolyspora halophila TaxID=405551 RepID=A0ABN3GVT2_9PSEU